MREIYEVCLCQRCGSKSIAFYKARCKDQFYVKWPDGNEEHGYVPQNEICGVRSYDDGDCMSVYLCLFCGQVQGEFPKLNLKGESDERNR